MDLRACFRKVDVTPADDGHPLLGYFTPRLSEGTLDPLHCRLAGLYLGDESLVVAQIDTCLMRAEEADMVASAISRRSGIPRERIMVCASHAHTAPALADLYDVRQDSEYLGFLVSRVEEAAATLRPERKVPARICRGRAPGLAFNRRWFLASGEVVTNPPRRHPALDRPEGPVDDEVNTLAFEAEDGTIPGMLVSISNHADTIGGNRISADWPGLMEREVNAALGADAVVVPLIGAAGNINHFDFTSVLDQTRYEEALRISRGYAAVAAATLSKGQAAESGPLKWAMEQLIVPAIEITPAELKNAREILSRPAPGPREADLTAEDIFRGDPAVERMFAGSLVDLAERGPPGHTVPLQAFRLGDVGIFAIPGEPFVEIGLALKSFPGFDLIMPVGLANGYLGYIPLRECFDRGGYEVKPGPARLCRDAADRILAVLAGLARLL